MLVADSWEATFPSESLNFRKLLIRNFRENITPTRNFTCFKLLFRRELSKRLRDTKSLKIALGLLIHSRPVCLLNRLPLVTVKAVITLLQGVLSSNFHAIKKHGPILRKLKFKLSLIFTCDRQSTVSLICIRGFLYLLHYTVGDRILETLVELASVRLEPEAVVCKVQVANQVFRRASLLDVILVLQFLTLDKDSLNWILSSLLSR